jgi:RHS repeat-associated protein
VSLVIRRMRAVVLAGSLAAVAVLSAGAGAARADEPSCDVVWTGPLTGIWSSGANWSTSSPPGAGDVACLPAGTQVTVDGDATAAAVNGPAADLTIDGALDLTDPAGQTALRSLTQTGELTSEGEIDVSGSLEIGGALANYPDQFAPDVSGSGSLTLGPDGVGVLHDVWIDGLALINNGTINQRAADGAFTQPLIQVVGSAGASIDNRGTYTLEGEPCLGCTPPGILAASFDDLPQFHNEGTFKRTGGTSALYVMMPFDNDGSVEIHDGNVEFDQIADGTISDGSWSGTSEGRPVLSSADGQPVQLGDHVTITGPMTFHGDASVSSIDAPAGDVEVDGELTLRDQDAASSVYALELGYQGTLAGEGVSLTVHSLQTAGLISYDGDLHVTHDLVALSGRLTGPGRLLVDSGASASIQASEFLDGYRFENHGAVTQTGFVGIHPTATIDNYGTYSVNNECDTCDGAGAGLWGGSGLSDDPPSFVNDGVFATRGATQAQQIGIDTQFLNRGQVRVYDGPTSFIDVNGGPTSPASTGSWEGIDGGTVGLTGQHLAAESSFSGDLQIGQGLLSNGVWASKIDDPDGTLTLDGSLYLTDPTSTSRVGTLELGLDPDSNPFNINWSVLSGGTLHVAHDITTHPITDLTELILTQDAGLVLDAGAHTDPVRTTLDVATRIVNHGDWTSESMVSYGQYNRELPTFRNDGRVFDLSTPCSQCNGVAYAFQGLGVLINNGAISRSSTTPSTIQWRIEGDGSLNGPFTIPGTSTGAPQPADQFGGSNPSEPYIQHPCAADPVDCATGNLIENQTDLAVGGVPGLALTRTYNSQLTATQTSPGAFGYGWTATYTDHLVVRPDLHRITVHQANGSQTPFSIGESGTIQAPAWVQATLVPNPDGTYTYTLPDQTVFTFDADGRLTAEADRNGNATSLSYSDGRLSEVTDPSGRALHYSHNEDGTVAAVTDPAGVTVRYTYVAGELTAVTYDGQDHDEWRFGYDASHQLTTLTDPRGHSTTTSYDRAGRAVSQTDALDRTHTWRYDQDETTITNPAGDVTHERFLNGQPTEITRGYGTPAATTARMSYDPTTLAQTSITDGNNHATTYEYDAAGNRTAATLPDGRRTTWEYNASRDLTQTTSPSGKTTSITRDAHGNPTGVTTTAPSPSTATRHQTASYDSRGLVTSATDPALHVTSFVYDDRGELLSTTDPLGNTTSYTYDDDSRMSSVTSPRGHASGADPEAFTTMLQRDLHGRVTQTTDPLGHASTTTYDPDGNPTAQTDAAGHAATSTYDAANQLTATTSDGKTKTTHYDENGRVTATTDEAGKSTHYAYDAASRLVSTIDPRSRTTSYGYDEAGQPVTLTDPAGRVTTTSYDTVGRVTGLHYSSGSPGDQSFAYDDEDRRTSMTDDTGTTTYAYDPLGRTTSVNDGHGKTVSYGYDADDNVTTITYPATQAGPGGDVTRGYDADGQLTSVTDPTGNETTFAYDPDGNQTTTTYPAATGNVDEVTSDANGAPTAIALKHAGSAVASFGYTRDQLGRVASSTTSGIPGDDAHSYDYDARGQLTAADSQNYEYGDNRTLTALDDATNGTYDDARELTGLTVDGGPASYDYDALGDRTSYKPLNGPATTYDYDQTGQLTAVHPALQAPHISAGTDNTVAIDQSGTGHGWGGGAFGQLGDGSPSDSSIPVTFTGLPNIVQVTIGNGDSLALDTNGEVYGWGSNNHGELGPAAPPRGRSAAGRIPGLTSIVQLASGATHNLALSSDAHVYSWGSNDNGELGDTTTDENNTPEPLADLSDVAQVAAGDGFSLARRTDGTVVAWGANDSGQLGDGTTTSETSPVEISGLHDIVQIAAGSDFAMALDDSGHVWEWGADSYGQLGTTGGQATTPTQLTSLSAITQIAAGAAHALALDSSAHVYAWGSNEQGELGDGTTTSNATPQQVSGLTSITRIAAGNEASYAIHADGTISAWGNNYNGQLGDSTTTSRTTPVTVTGLTLTIPDPAEHYAYNADGLRESTTNTLASTHDTWDTTSSDLPVMLADDHTEFIYGPNDLPIEQIVADGTISYLHHDQLGSTRVVTDATGAVAGTATYTPYGKLAGHTGITSPIGYAGQSTDPATGLVYMRARDYDPQTGQFMTRDPLERETGDAYAYAAGDPINQRDPSGETTVGLCLNAKVNIGPLELGVQGCAQLATSGEIGVNVTGNGGVAGSPSLLGGSVGPSVQVSNANHIHELDGKFGYGNYSAVLGGGVSQTLFGGTTGSGCSERPIFGTDIGLLAGEKISVSGGQSYTKNFHLSIPDVFRHIFG